MIEAVNRLNSSMEEPIRAKNKQCRKIWKSYIGKEIEIQ